MSHEKATKKLINLLKSLRDGVSLLIMVTRGDRVKESMKRNYEFFVKGICQNEVPVLLVKTGCDGVFMSKKSNNEWWLENKAIFDRNG